MIEGAEEEVMSRSPAARLSVAAALAVTLAACSRQSPVAPAELFPPRKVGPADARGSTEV